MPVPVTMFFPMSTPAPECEEPVDFPMNTPASEREESGDVGTCDTLLTPIGCFRASVQESNTSKHETSSHRAEQRPPISRARMPGKRKKVMSRALLRGTARDPGEEDSRTSTHRSM